MSARQEGDAVGDASKQNQGYYSNAQNSYANAQSDAGEFENAAGTYAGQVAAQGKNVAAFSAANPYGQGGQAQTVTNQQLTNTADAMAQSSGQALQSQALRTGQNSAGDVAATEAMQQQNERNLSGQEADATQQRIGAGAEYGAKALAAGQQQVSDDQTVVGNANTAFNQQAGLAGQQAGDANSALGNQVNAAKTPSFMDEFGNAVATGLGKTLTGNRG